MNFLPNLFFFDGILHDHYILSTTQKTAKSVQKIL